MAYRKKAPKRFTEQLGRTLREAIMFKQLKRAEAAKMLGVQRMGLFNFITGEDCPRADVLFKACQKLGLSFEYDGWILKAEPKNKTTAPVPEQMGLFEEVRNKDLDISILKKSPKSLDLQVRIQIPV